ncbi:helix-turn-helix transcriptional regulator [Nocardia anaemiae]|uniref:helix-turn-helix transcriptional regulator n=1 Tax=Nocardia anaemiae TaxID=263910 RepID=UPI0007A4A9AD|nr:helix-turn-helix transcriptional regulator [Nocardia anaemiae]
MTDEDSGRDDIRVDDEGRRLAERIRSEREYLNLKQEQVAEVLKTSRAAVSAIETGRRKVSGQELKRLAELFGTSVDRLLGSGPEEDETTTALFRTARTLSDHDRMQVLRFAEFLRNAGPAPQLDDKTGQPRPR